MDDHSSASVRQSRDEREHDDNELNHEEHSGVLSSPQLPEAAERQDSSSSLHFSDAADATDLHGDRERSLDEREIRRQLGDFESSFLPESGPPEMEEHAGADDTYMNLGSSTKTSPLKAFLGPRGQSENMNQDDDAGDERNETMSEEDDYERYRQSQSSTDQDVMDSPSAAAAQRNTARTRTPSGLRNELSARAVADSVPSRSSSKSFHRGSSLARSHSSGSGSQRSQRTLQSQTNDSRLALPSITTSEGSPASTASPLKRPAGSHNRIASHTSTVSTNSNSTINADFALSTGVPSNNSPLSSRTARDLNRLPSFGSVVSDMSRDPEAGKPSFNRGFSAATGLLRSKIREAEEEASASPITPRASTFPSKEPSDTVIAAHVRDIHVPDTVARDFQSRFGARSPDKRTASIATNTTSTTTGRGQSTLTLKEQGSKIDKLTKENFDLKLKIHFLDQALQSRSDEGVKAMISRSVELQTDLAKERRDNASLRRRVRELERRVGEVEEELAEERERGEEVKWRGQQEMEVEISELREELDEERVKVTKLSAENLAKEMERRKMAEYLSAVQERNGQGDEEVEMWKDLLTEEQGRREGVEEEARGLREELGRMRREKERWLKEREQGERSRSIASEGGKSASSGTLVEQLRHENVELRRDLSAQTSMLSSRNKERERLQQEIEDLKLLQRKGGDRRSMTGDSILERSASRAARTPSRASGMTGSRVSDAERDEYERREGLLRDENAQLRLEYQDIEKEADARLDYITQLEEDVKNLEVDLSAAVEDLRALQTERDEALMLVELRESDLEKVSEDYRKLEEEAVFNIEGLEADMLQTQTARDRTANELRSRNEDFSALQSELKSLASKLLSLESDREASLKRISTLEAELDEASTELDTFERKFRETEAKNQRLEVSSESLQNEITFLREEQEGDKIKIGDLTNALHAAQQAVADEKERMAELEASLVEERRQRELIDDQSKQEVQQVINELNAENSRSRDDLRRLRRSVSTKENEAMTYKSRLEELETNLRRALGDLAGTRSTLLQDVEKLQHDLGRTAEELEGARADVADKDRLIKSRDVLLESSGLEARRLSDLLDKERQARKHDLHNFEMAQRGNSGHLRAIANHETRSLELETALSQAKRKLGTLEGQYKTQLEERNALLLSLWNRLSTVCGTEWSQQNGGLGGAVTSVESIGRHLPQFQRNILAACKAIEGLFSGLKGRIRMAERSMAKDVSTLSHTLEQKIKRLEQVERMASELVEVNTQLRTAIANSGLGASTGRSPSAASGSFGQNKLSKAHQEEMKVLKTEIKSLQKELKIHRALPSEEAAEKIKADPEIRSTNSGNRRSSVLGLLGVGDGEGSRLSPATIAGKILRTNSEGAVRTLNLGGNRHSVDLARQGSTASTSTNRQSVDLQAQGPGPVGGPGAGPNDQRWIHRLRELEKRLKAEREARLLDRKGARQRLEERSAENEGLRQELERERERNGSITSLDSFRSFDGEEENEQVMTPRASLSRRETERSRRERSQDSVD
ncbi:Anucleate primary sterigmata protein B-like protein [Elsinoe fawcettii]|nr:Anucleate primary sterigmata protein B-like protein [Elsinoe fawcettii]